MNQPWQGRMLPLHHSRMGGMIGVEPTFIEPQSIVLPLDDIPHILGSCFLLGIEPKMSALHANVLPLDYNKIFC